MNGALDIAVVGPALDVAGIDGPAATWRMLLGALQRRGHRIRYYERAHTIPTHELKPSRGLSACRVPYADVAALRERYAGDIVAADVVMLGSQVPDGVRVADWLLRRAHGLVVHYDLDTFATLARLCTCGCDCRRGRQIAAFDLYLSVAGGPVVRWLRQHGAHARPLYRAADADAGTRAGAIAAYDLGYLGSYCAYRQRLLRWYVLKAAAAWPRGRFVVAGAGYPETLDWPANVHRVDSPTAARRPAFYRSQAFALNLADAGLGATGWAPAAGLFAAAASGVPIICDAWRGIDTLFAPGKEMLLAQEPGQVLEWLQRMPATTQRMIGAAARRRVLAEHTADHRAETLERYIDGVVPRPTAHAVEQRRAS